MSLDPDHPLHLSTRRAFLHRSGQAALVGMSTLAAPSLLNGTAEAASPTASAQLAQDAVIFGVPAVSQARILARSLQAGIELNRFSVNTTLSTPATKAPGPNDDTLYGLTWLSLVDGPQVIEVPSTRGRYFSIQLIDMWTNAFGYIGTRATGDRAGAFAITASDWSGTLPAGVRRIAAPTKHVLVLVRTGVNSPADLHAAQQIHTSYTTGPLSHYPRRRIKAHVEPDAAAINVLTPVDLSGSGVSLFSEINALLAEYPPLPADAAHARRLRPVGVDVPHYTKPGAHLAPVLAGAVAPALAQISARAQTLLTEENGWGVNLHVGNVTHDPLSRAAIDINGPGTNVAKEALYFFTSKLEGAPLSGAHSYALTFPRGQEPPVGAFWSLILYDATTFLLVPNPIDRYEVASHTKGLVRAADGSLTIAIQNTQPTASDVNWLPAPAGGFRLILRTYLPKPAIAAGHWTPPRLVQTA